jgi:hypothetical protein
MHGAIRAAGFSLMTMFVSCGVGAQDPDTRIGQIVMEGELPASIQTKQASGVVDGRGFASCLRGRGLNFDELRRGCVSPRTSALL